MTDSVGHLRREPPLARGDELGSRGADRRTGRVTPTGSSGIPPSRKPALRQLRRGRARELLGHGLGIEQLTAWVRPAQHPLS